MTRTFDYPSSVPRGPMKTITGYLSWWFHVRTHRSFELHQVVNESNTTTGHRWVLRVHGSSPSCIGCLLKSVAYGKTSRRNASVLLHGGFGGFHAENRGPCSPQLLHWPKLGPRTGEVLANLTAAERGWLVAADVLSVTLGFQAPLI